MSTVQVQIPFVLAPHQAIVRNCKRRHRVMACGRRSGKTLGAVYMTVEFLTTNDDSVGWWVAPTFGLTRKGMRETIHFLRGGHKHLVKAVLRAEKRIEFVNGSFIEFHTAENPDSLVGEGLDWLVVDEAGLIANPDVWPQYLRPALADREGRALFISSPRGRNWFYEIFLLGQKPDEVATDGAVTANEWASWNIPTAAAGFVRPSELAEIQRTTPERIWEQEYLARFREDGGDVFRKIDAAMGPAQTKGQYIVMGVDLAKTHDWTVVWVLNERGEWMAIDRFHEIDWAIQKPRIVNLYKKLQCSRAILDTTGMHVGGDAVLQDLRADGLICEGVTLTGGMKRAIIENAMLRFDNTTVTIPNDPVVTDEFKRFTYFELPSGAERYAAPGGYHDDIVIAATLALWGIKHIQAIPIEAPKTALDLAIERELIEANPESWSGNEIND